LPYGSPGVDAPVEGTVRTPAESLAAAQQLLDDGLPFHAHEVFEDAWKTAPSGERDLWRGLAQLAVGATHAGRGNRAGALALLRRGSSAVGGWRAESPYQLDVDGVLRWSEAAIEQVEAQCPVDLPAPRLTRGVAP
jgi:predicted metal-dependent hydrolase